MLLSPAGPRASENSSEAFRPLLPAVLLYLLEEGVEDPVLVHLAQRTSLGEDHTVVLAAGDAVVGVARLAGTVDDTAHYGDGEVVLVVL